MTRRRSAGSRPLTRAQYQRLVDDISRLLERGRRRAEEAVGRELVLTYHAIGKRLLAAKLSGHAGYGTATLRRLADDLGVKQRVLQRAVAFAQAYPSRPPKTGLTWTHYRALLPVADPQQRGWYATEAERGGWSAAKLARAIREKHYEEPPAPSARKSSRKRRLRQLPRPSEATHVYEATVERVIDGDTLLVVLDLGFDVLKRQRLRLARIDTPAVDTPAGAAARDFVQDELARVEFVMLKTDKIDLYGRYVAHVFYEPEEHNEAQVFATGRYLNQRLVDQGLAEPL
jgi:endonuclease YncB( thermonuclease family)